MHEETKTSNQYNHLYITEELWQVLDSSTSIWHKLIPGHTGEFQKTTKVISPSNCKKIIPSYELFLCRKLLQKQTKDQKDLCFSGEWNNSRWLDFGLYSYNMISQVASDYITISTMLKPDMSNSKARSINLLVDLRYVNILISSYCMILITAFWHWNDKMLTIYMLSIVRSIQELGNILLSIEGLASIRSKRDLESILASIMNAKTKEYPKIIKPEQYKEYMKNLELEYFQIMDLKKNTVI